MQFANHVGYIYFFIQTSILFRNKNLCQTATTAKVPHVSKAEKGEKRIDETNILYPFAWSNDIVLAKGGGSIPQNPQIQVNVLNFKLYCSEKEH